MDSKKKKIIIIGSGIAAAVIATILVLTLVCFHSWKDATCNAPMTCEKCNATQGEPLTHEWMEANCVEAQHCIKCGLTKGEALGHSIKEMKTTRETSCSLEGERTGFCDRCQNDCVEKIEKLPHTESKWQAKKDYVFTPDGNVEPGTEIIICTVCKEELESREITVELTVSQKNAVICAYEELSFWHCGPDFLIHTVMVEFEGFPVADARLAVSHMDVDWDEQAVLYAKENFEGSSRAGLTEEMRYYGFNNTQIEKALKEVGY